MIALAMFGSTITSSRLHDKSDYHVWRKMDQILCEYRKASAHKGFFDAIVNAHTCERTDREVGYRARTKRRPIR